MSYNKKNKTMETIYWASSNIKYSKELHRFVPTRNHPHHFGNSNPRIVAQAQEIFNAAKRPYILFGNALTASDGVTMARRSLLFTVTQRRHAIELVLDQTRSGAQNIAAYDAIPNELSPHDRLQAFFAEVFYLAGRIFFAKPVTMKFRGKYYLYMVQNILQSTVAAEWSHITIDNDKQLIPIAAFLTNPGDYPIRNSFTVWSVTDVNEPEPESAQKKYVVAKRRLETFLINHNIKEGQPAPPLAQSDLQTLIERYGTWFAAMRVFRAEDMSATMQELINDIPHLWGDDDEQKTARDTVTHNEQPWSEFFMTFDTKYPVLLATVYMWRLRHWMSLVFT